MKKFFLVLTIACLGSAASFIGAARAEWVQNGTIVFGGIEDSEMTLGDIAPDGGGGAIIAWGNWDYYSASWSSNRMQKISSDGVCQWGSPTLMDCMERWAGKSRIAADGAGGVFYAAAGMSTGGNESLCSYRVYSGGTRTGFVISTYPSYDCLQENPQIIPDGAGGAIITWQEYRIGDDGFDIYAQRIDESNTALWGPEGVAVCTASGYQEFPQLASDGAGGAIISWEQDPDNIYAQRVDAGGTVRWPGDGLLASPTAELGNRYQITADGAGGAIITWQDTRSVDDDVYAQRIDTSGAVLWTEGGIPVCTESGTQDYPALVPDGTGGAIIGWRDQRGGTYDVYAQRIDASGAAQWEANGIAISSGPGDQRCPRLVPDGLYGAIFAWADDSDGDFDIYAQCIDENGNELWTPGGVPVCNEEGDQDDIVMTPAGPGEAIVVWVDYRTWSWGEIYAMLVNYILVPVEPQPPSFHAELYQNHPNPFNPTTTFEYYLPGRCDVKLELFDANGRRIALLVDAEQEQGFHTIEWRGTGRDGSSMASGVYFYRLTAGEEVISKKSVLLR